MEVKFVNRTRHAVQLEWITPQGRREKKKVLAKGRCWRTTSWEGHYWVCCDPKHDEHLFALNYGLHYRVQKTRGARERVVITAGLLCFFQLFSEQHFHSNYLNIHYCKYLFMLSKKFAGSLVGWLPVVAARQCKGRVGWGIFGIKQNNQKCSLKNNDNQRSLRNHNYFACFRATLRFTTEFMKEYMN